MSKWELLGQKVILAHKVPKVHEVPKVHKAPKWKYNVDTTQFSRPCQLKAIPTHCPLEDWRIKNYGFHEPRDDAVGCAGTPTLDCCYVKSSSISCINDCAQYNIDGRSYTIPSQWNPTLDM